MYESSLSSLFQLGAEYGYAGSSTVCVEGTNNSDGSHGGLHKKLLVSNGGILKSGKTLMYESAKTNSINAHREQFKNGKKGKGKPTCSTKCIEKQLDHYFKDKCKNSDFKVRQVNGSDSTCYGGGL